MPDNPDTPSNDSDDADLERTIAALIERKYAAVPGSAEYRMAVRQLLGLRSSRENAGPIMEDLDPIGWGAISVAPPLQECPCGSGHFPNAHHDARGIFLCYACPKCEAEKLSRDRPDVLTDPSYWHDEPIDSD